MSKSHWQITLLLVLVCGGILVLFTNAELRLVRWLNCSPLAPASERDSEVCRRLRGSGPGQDRGLGIGP
jgi:hypothetical protein